MHHPRGQIVTTSWHPLPFCPRGQNQSTEPVLQTCPPSQSLQEMHGLSALLWKPNSTSVCRSRKGQLHLSLKLPWSCSLWTRRRPQWLDRNCCIDKILPVQTSFSSALLSYISGVHDFGEIFAYVTFFFFNPTITSHSVFMDGACCVCICCRQSRTWMSGSFESMGEDACVFRLDLSLYSHSKNF